MGETTMKHTISNKLCAALAAAMLVTGVPACKTVRAEETGIKEMYRLYNPNSGEHFYTAKAKERDDLVKFGWKDEGIGWYAPEKSESPVYRLYNKYGGEHHYTLKKAEKDALVKAGWTDEGIGWYSDDEKVVPVFREYNPNAHSCNHNYTIKFGEHEALEKAGWNGEGVGWYGVDHEKHEFVQLNTHDSLIDMYEVKGWNLKEPGSTDYRPEGYDPLYESDTIWFYMIEPIDDEGLRSFGIEPGRNILEYAQNYVKHNKEHHDIEYKELVIEDVNGIYARVSYMTDASFFAEAYLLCGGQMWRFGMDCPKKYRPEYEKLFNQCLNRIIVRDWRDLQG